MLRFDHPHVLWLTLLALPLIAVGWRAMVGMDGVRRVAALVIRTLLFAAMVFMLAGPRMVREHQDLTVIGLLDISGSVQRFADLPPLAGADVGEPARRSNIEYLRQWFRQATQTRTPNDRFGLVVFDGKATAISTPTRADYVDDNLDIRIAEGTNIADAVRLGLAMFPADTAKRLVLITDGNETTGSAVQAVRQSAGTLSSPLTIEEYRFDDPAASADGSRQTVSAARRSSIPVDVLPIAYNVKGDVQIVRVEAPAGALAGQTVMVRVVLQSTTRTSGRLTLRREGVEMDLNGPDPGTSRAIDVPEGQSVFVAQVTLGQTPINRFEAIFEPDDFTVDRLADNNRAEAFTATPSKGSVLIIDAQLGGTSNALAEILSSAELPVTVNTPELLPGDLLSLQNFDLVILDNVAAAQVPPAQRELLARYVNDLGGGLIMVGGDDSFGAGGWNNTPVEDILPVEMDPSKELRLPSAALVFVLDKSGSMNQPVAGARASQQQVANEGAALAIKSLRSDSLIGVVAFDMFPSIVVPLRENSDAGQIAEEVLAIRAEGGTNMPPAIARAYEMLKDVKAEKKRIVCMSDGRSHSNDYEAILTRLNAANIQLSTIAVGDDADDQTLRALAEAGGGEFYAVRDPRTLPRVLVESVQVINKPLLKETPFTPKVLTTGSTLTVGMEQSSTLNGIVITSVRNDPKVVLEMITPDGEPLLAHWQAGLGRAAAFTSSHPATGSWAARWSGWPVAQTFWTQLARTIARPAMNTEAELLATIDGDQLNITYEITGGSGSPESNATSTSRLLEYLRVAGTVYSPDGGSHPVTLRQTAPGRYETTIDAPHAGNYIVALNPRQGSRALAPAIGGASKSTSPEYRRFRSNIGLLEEIAEVTGGRTLDLANPQSIDLFDRSNMPRSESSLPIWPTLLPFVIALLLLDVACRRLAWDVPMLQRAAGAALARVTPARLRGRRSAEVLSTLRRVSQAFDERQESTSEGVAKLKGSGRLRPPPQRVIRSDGSSIMATTATPGIDATPPTHAEAGSPAPDSRQVAAALDTLFEREASPDTESPQSADTAPSPEKPVPPPSASETTSGLLAAKRRARERMDRGE